MTKKIVKKKREKRVKVNAFDSQSASTNKKSRKSTTPFFGFLFFCLISPSFFFSCYDSMALNFLKFFFSNVSGGKSEKNTNLEKIKHVFFTPPFYKILRKFVLVDHRDGKMAIDWLAGFHSSLA